MAELQEIRVRRAEKEFDLKGLAERLKAVRLYFETWCRHKLVCP